MKRKLLLVANRLPIRFEEDENGLKIHDSEGGLATGLASLDSGYEKEWIGWPGIHTECDLHRKAIAGQLGKNYHPVFLDKEETDLYYKGFSNETLWPLFHYFMEFTRYKDEYWDAYKRVNEKFCEKVLQTVSDGDIIWIHDYHLMLLPGMLRKKLGNRNPIGFFLHIPFPSYEMFRTLPQRKKLLKGLLGADLLGFHTSDYMQHFKDTARRILGLENRLGTIPLSTHSCNLNVFPMGINFEKFKNASECAAVVKQLASFQQKTGNVKVVLSVDRLDYTKGIVNRLHAFDKLLGTHPELRGKVSLIMLTVPSRDSVSEYKNLKIEVDEIVGNINGRYSTLTWTAVHYFYRSVSFEELVAMYNLADIALVTPLRDGMNLVAKEYVASKTHGNGVLILSEMAGAAIELEGALRINPNDRNGMVKALHTALNMPPEQQQERMAQMQQQVKMHCVEKWGRNFTSQLCNTPVPAKTREKVEIKLLYKQAV